MRSINRCSSARSSTRSVSRETRSCTDLSPTAQQGRSRRENLDEVRRRRPDTGMQLRLDLIQQQRPLPPVHDSTIGVPVTIVELPFRVRHSNFGPSEGPFEISGRAKWYSDPTTDAKRGPRKGLSPGKTLERMTRFELATLTLAR
jgi:hypothetical protein